MPELVRVNGRGVIGRYGSVPKGVNIGAIYDPDLAAQLGLNEALEILDDLSIDVGDMEGS
jgi:hypothetical protein